MVLGFFDAIRKGVNESDCCHLNIDFSARDIRLNSKSKEYETKNIKRYFGGRRNKKEISEALLDIFKLAKQYDQPHIVISGKLYEGTPDEESVDHMMKHATDLADFLKDKHLIVSSVLKEIEEKYQYKPEHYSTASDPRYVL